MQQIALILIFLLALIAMASGQSSSSCPTISFANTGLAVSGHPHNFLVELSNIEHAGQLSYQWSTSLGTITSGFGTANIKILLAEEDAGKNFTVTVRIVGLPAGCPHTLSETLPIAPRISDEFPPTFGAVRNAVVYAHVDTWIISGMADQGLKPVAVMRFSENETDRSRLRRLRQILSTLRFRKKMANVSFAIVETPSRSETVLTFQRPGSDFKLQGESFVLIKAEELEKNPERILGTKVCTCYRKIK